LLGCAREKVKVGRVARASSLVLHVENARHLCQFIFVSILLLCLSAVSGNAQQKGPAPNVSTLVAGNLNGTIRLDGVLDEPAWRDAGMLAELVQQAPKPGEATPYKTTVRVLITSDHLYFGFECIDPDPSKIAIHTMQRDGDVQGDDTVAIVLDTYGDRRTGYFFRVNAAGARVDGLIAGPEDPKLDWDGIWDARTARFAWGWSAEIAVPSRSLSFTRGLSIWGVTSNGAFRGSAQSCAGRLRLWTHSFTI